MADKQKQFNIEHLDSGYVVEEGGKRKAITHLNMVEEIIQSALREITSGLSKSSVNNMSIKIEVSENLPQCR